MTVTSSNYQRRENDMYETETWAVEALLRALPVLDKNSRIWEPAAGNHAISDHLKRLGFAVINSDIKTYEKQHDFELNFFAATQKHGDAIITNPPYGKTGHKLAARFAEHALKLCDGKTGTDNHAWYVWAPNDYSHGMPRLFWEGKTAREPEAVE